jgi:hypothetical protein
MLLDIKEGCSELARYLTSRLIVEDAVWSSLFLREESSTIKAIKYTLNETNKINVSDQKIDWLLLNCPNRFKKVNHDLWDLTAWHVRKNASFNEKAQAILRLSQIPLPSDDLTSLLNRSNDSGKTTPDIVDRLLRSCNGTFEKFWSYWFLKEWTNVGNVEQFALLKTMITRNNERKIARLIDPRQTCKALFFPLNAAVDIENLKWAFEYNERNSNLDFIFNSGIMEPVCGGYWIPYDLIPELIRGFNNMEISRIRNTRIT